MIKALLIAALTFVAGQASALSCMRADVARTFHWAADAEERYLVLLGEFTFIEPEVDSADLNDSQSVIVPATFEGSYLGADGFVSGAALDVTLNFNCAGPCFASLESNSGPIMAFIEQTPDAYTLNVGPCYSTVFIQPTPSDIERVEACMRGEDCLEFDATY
jgi:hypothetical protein